MDSSGETYDLLIIVPFQFLLQCVNIFQLLLLTLAAALYRTLQSKEGEAETRRGISENDYKKSIIWRLFLLGLENMHCNCNLLV